MERTFRHYSLPERRKPATVANPCISAELQTHRRRDVISAASTRSNRKTTRATIAFLCCLCWMLWLHSGNFVTIGADPLQLPDGPIFQETRKKNVGCDRFKGILHISQGDSQGAAGTIFFLFVLNQLLYAERFHLLPWIHLNNQSHYVYDPILHGQGRSVTFQTLHGVIPSTTGFIDPISKQQVLFPGRPIQQNQSLRQETIAVTGNGVWETYFDPVSDFSPGDCPELPLVRLTPSQLISIHINWPPAIRAWRYGGMPPSLIQPELPYQQWFQPMRERGSSLVEKYVRPKPYLLEMARRVNPNSELCLAIHIRHSDKANRRKRIAVKKFLPYVQAYDIEMQNHTRSIYLATDSHKVIENIQQGWPPELLHTMAWQEEGVVRSNDTTAVFKLASHHETNTQVLVDILALSRCQFLLHGLSAVSEAVMYLNRGLHMNHSINLETRHATVQDFQRTIQTWKKENSL